MIFEWSRTEEYCQSVRGGEAFHSGQLTASDSKDTVVTYGRTKDAEITETVK